MTTIQQGLALYHQLETVLRKAAAEKRPMTVRDIERQAPNKDIELVFDDVTIIIGKNPETGRIRIVIE